jgi:hypothetical protein
MIMLTIFFFHANPLAQDKQQTSPSVQSGLVLTTQVSTEEVLGWSQIVVILSQK